jgi:hypothetical protein
MVMVVIVIMVMVTVVIVIMVVMMIVVLIMIMLMQSVESHDSRPDSRQADLPPRSSAATSLVKPCSRQFNVGCLCRIFAAAAAQG